MRFPPSTVTMQAFTVETQREGQALAITEQRNAPNVKNVTALDESAVDATLAPLIAPPVMVTSVDDCVDMDRSDMVLRSAAASEVPTTVRAQDVNVVNDTAEDPDRYNSRSAAAAVDVLAANTRPSDENAASDAADVLGKYGTVSANGASRPMKLVAVP